MAEGPLGGPGSGIDCANSVMFYDRCPVFRMRSSVSLYALLDLGNLSLTRVEFGLQFNGEEWTLMGGL